MGPRQRWLGRAMWVQDSTGSGRAVNASPTAQQPGCRSTHGRRSAPSTRTRGMLILRNPCPACFQQIVPQAARPDLFPADLCLLSSKSFPFPPVHPVLSPFPRSTSHNPLCKLGAPSLLCLFSVPFSRLARGLEGC